MVTRTWSLPSSIPFQSSISPHLRRSSRLSLLILGIHGVAVAMEDILFGILFSLDRWIDQWCQSHLALLVKQEILTPSAGESFTAKLTQVIGVSLIETGVLGVGLAIELGLLVMLWKFAWEDPTSQSPSCDLRTQDGLQEGALELCSVTAAVSFLTLNAFFLLATFCTSIFFRALDGFGARLSWSTPISSVAGLALGAFVVGHFAPALFQSSLQFARNRITPHSLPIIETSLHSDDDRSRWRERLRFHFPSFQGRVVALMVLPLSLIALANNLVWVFALIGGT